jgi:transposase
MDPAQIIFVDESGVTTEMTRRYGRALNGARVEEGVSRRSLANTDDPGSGEYFRVGSRRRRGLPGLSQHVLCPQLKPGQLVVMDNLGAHKVDGVKELIEKTAAGLCYLPPYSPDFNPIEKCWAQVKQRLRAVRARSLATLQQALPDALATVTSQNTINYFHHCGCGL